MTLEDGQASVFALEDFDFIMFLGVPMMKTGKKFSDEGNTLRITKKAPDFVTPFRVAY